MPPAERWRPERASALFFSVLPMRLSEVVGLRVQGFGGLGFMGLGI